MNMILYRNEWNNGYSLTVFIVRDWKIMCSLVAIHECNKPGNLNYSSFDRIENGIPLNIGTCTLFARTLLCGKIKNGKIWHAWDL